MTTTASPIVDEAFLTKAAEIFASAPSDTLTAVDNHDQDGQKLAEDMYQVFISFKSSSTQFGKVDCDYQSKWKGQWDPLSDSYGKGLEKAKLIAIKGEEYINDFNTNVTNKFSTGASNVKGDVQLLKNWLDANEGDRGLKSETQQLSQGYLDLSNDVTALRDSFDSFAIQKGAAYDSDIAKLQRDVKDLQQKIDWEQSAAADAQDVLDGFVGTLASVGGFFESMFTFGLSHTLWDEAKDRFTNHFRRAQELRSEKDRLTAQSIQLAKDNSQLHDVQNTVTILAQDVIDVSGRLGVFANMWARAHSGILELRSLLDGATTVHTALFFRLKVGVISSSSAVYAADMKRFSDALVYVGNAQGIVAYDLSPQFGGSDVTRGILFNDARDLELDIYRPIISIMITSGWVVDGIEIRYRLINGEIRTVAHGTIRYNTAVTLWFSDDEYISSATGKSGHAGNGEPWMGDCVQQLELKVNNSKTGGQRTYGPYGTAQGLDASSTTMIPWSGRLLAFAGSADNNASQVGLRGIAFVKLADNVKF